MAMKFVASQLLSNKINVSCRVTDELISAYDLTFLKALFVSSSNLASSMDTHEILCGCQYHILLLLH